MQQVLSAEVSDDPVRRASDIARGNVVSLIRVCNNWFALSRVNGVLVIRRLR